MTDERTEVRDLLSAVSEPLPRTRLTVDSILTEARRPTGFGRFRTLLPTVRLMQKLRANRIA